MWQKNFFTVDTIKSWEKGMITQTIDKLRLISKTCNVSFDYLLVCALETPKINKYS